MDPTIAHAVWRKLLLGESPSAELVLRFSNELHVDSNKPPVFIFCAADDRAVDPENSFRFYHAARAAGVPAELHVFEQGGHGFGLCSVRRAASAWPVLCRSWLEALPGLPVGNERGTP
jgi:acetyl esterase/lipase